MKERFSVIGSRAALGCALGGAALLGACAGGPDFEALKAPKPAPRVAAAQAVSETGSIPLLRRGGYLLAEAEIHDVAVGPMLIDTGASLGVIAQGVAGRLKLNKNGRGRTVGVGGVEAFDYVDVDRITLGAGPPSQARLGLPAGRRAALNLRRFDKALRAGITGIVGFNELSTRPFTLDAAARTLTVHDPSAFRPPRDAARERLELYRGLPLVRAEIRSNRGPVTVWLLIDSGADRAITLPDTLLRDHPGLAATRFSGRGRTTGVGGGVESTQTWLGQIRLFGLNLESLPVSFEPPPPTMSHGETGLHIGRVGNQLLQHLRITFDARRRWVYAGWAGPDGGPPAATSHLRNPGTQRSAGGG